LEILKDTVMEPLNIELDFLLPNNDPLQLFEDISTQNLF
jgi:hypothetical protein